MSLKLSDKMKLNLVEHGLLNSIPNNVKKEDGFKNMSQERKSEIEKKIIDDSKPIRVRYHNKDQDGHLEMPFCLGPGHPIQQWKFLCGEEYVVPKGLIHQVNDKSKRLPKRSQILDANGVPTIRDGHAQVIHQFFPVAEGF